MATLLAILSDTEIRQFNRPPKLSMSQRHRYFSLTTDLKRIVSRKKSVESKVGFILQMGYLKASGRFYPKESFRKQDIAYSGQS